MSKKLFSLIYGTENKIKANERIIPAAAIGELLDAESVLKKVYEDAEKYRIEVAGECELLKQKAEEEGFAAGYQKWAEQIGALENEIIQVRLDLEKMLIPVALKAAKKIVGREIELAEDTIVDIVTNALKAVSQHKKVTIFVNKRDLDPIERSRPRLKEVFEGLEVLSLREREDIPRGGCVIETEGGIINARLENQWSALERAFTTLMKNSAAGDNKEATKKDKTPSTQELKS